MRGRNLLGAKVFGIIAVAVTAASLTLGAAQLAADPGGKGDNKGKGKGKGNDAGVTVVLKKSPVAFRGGPPPWAPAHGYRRKGTAAAYAAPFGIDVGKCYREQIGQVLGGVAGAAIGSQVGQGTGKLVAVAGGTLLGVIVGGSIGRSLDQADYACAGQILEHAPNNQAIAWSNPQNGATYRMTPTNSYQADGRYCREYTTTASVGGQPQQTYGTACRQPDGAWQIVPR